MVIVAEEILTPDGEIMGMFLKENIPSGLSAAETITRIRAQQGLVCVPHPFDRFRPSAMGLDALEKIAEQVDIIEVFNARTLLLNNRKKAIRFADKYGLKKSAGSDAHTLPEVGNAYVEMPEFDGRDNFLESLSRGRIIGHGTNPLTHFSSLGNRIRKRFG
jgi:predicted metal-dependent phosphoesterase TrpH